MVTSVTGAHCKVNGSLKHACLAVVVLVFVTGTVVAGGGVDVFALAERKNKLFT